MTKYQKSAATRLGITAAEYAARIDAGQKWCARCKAWLMRSDFCNDRCEHDGLAKACRGCQAAYKRRFRSDNRDVVTAQRRAYYARHRRAIALRTSAKRWARKDAAAEAVQ